MARVFVVAPFLIIGLMVWAIVDIALIEHDRVRGIPKPGWFVVAILLPILGPFLWLFLGRESRAAHGRAGHYAGPVAPDDDPAFLRQLGKDKEQEERIRQLEERLAELDDDDPKP